MYLCMLMYGNMKRDFFLDVYTILNEHSQSLLQNLLMDDYETW